VGYHAVELLCRLGETVVVLANQAPADRRARAEAAGVRFVIGDARDDRLLAEAGLATAKAILAATDRDLVNVEIALDARRERPDLPVVLRLFDQALARQLEGAFGLRRAVGSSALASPSFAAAALGDAVIASFAADGEAYVAGRLPPGAANRKLPAGVEGLVPFATEDAEGGCVPCSETASSPPPSGRLLVFGRKADWDRLTSTRRKARGGHPKRWPISRRLARLSALWRDEPLALRVVTLSVVLLIPAAALVAYALGLSPADAVFFAVTSLHGEAAFAEGQPPHLKMYEILLMVLGSVSVAVLYSLLVDWIIGARLRKLLGGLPMPRSGHVVVAGLGHVGLRVIDELAELGVPAVAVEVDAEAPLLSAVRAKAAVVTGDARLGDTLERAGIAGARAIVAATEDDAVNFGIALAARELNPSLQAVLRLQDHGFAAKVSAVLGLGVFLGSARLAAPTYVAALLTPGVLRAFVVGDHLYGVVRSAERETFPGVLSWPLAPSWGP
jgi:Trk K+ transport system NAD-binding subunit